jgi:hypothetical protein
MLPAKQKCQRSCRQSKADCTNYVGCHDNLAYWFSGTAISNLNLSYPRRSLMGFRMPIITVFNSSFQYKIFGPKRDEVTGDWRKLHNEELNKLYSSPYAIYMDPYISLAFL